MSRTAMRIYGEESFGPVKAIVRVNGEEKGDRVRQ
jgi:acyl-CoA reductase-like NAD-dependent aldehyde dehydrogenase